MANGDGTSMGKDGSWNRNRYALTDNNFKNWNSLFYTWRTLKYILKYPKQITTHLETAVLEIYHGHTQSQF